MSKEIFSYSKLGVFEQCRFKYKLNYIDKHFIHDDSLATDFGTLIHYIEETMARKIQNNEPLDSKELISLLYNIKLESKYDKVYGVTTLKEKYPDEWNEKDKSDRTYQDKINFYINEGMFRLYDYLMRHPNLEIVGIEQEFNVEIEGYVFHGFIDRVFRDKDTGEIFIEDIKTWPKPAEQKELTTPLQFVLYNLAAQELYNATPDMISCSYELPLCDMKQPAGTKGYMTRGINKLKKLLGELSEELEFKPSPSPLCHWCVYSKTYPKQPEEAKNLCPYFSHWKPDKKDFSVEYDWMGRVQHDAILAQFIENELHPKEVITIKPVNVNLANKDRYFILRRS